MGADYKVYVGWYIKSPIKTQKVTSERYIDKKGNRTSHKFDPTTGKPNKIEYFDETVELVPNLYELEDDLIYEGGVLKTEFDWYDEEFLHSYDAADSVVYMLSDENSKFVKSLTWSYDGMIEVPLQVDYEREAVEFRRYVQKYLDLLKENYKDFTFTIEFGIIGHWT